MPVFTKSLLSRGKIGHREIVHCRTYNWAYLLPYPVKAARIGLRALIREKDASLEDVAFHLFQNASDRKALRLDAQTVASRIAAMPFDESSLRQSLEYLRHKRMRNVDALRERSCCDNCPTRLRCEKCQRLDCMFGFFRKSHVLNIFLGSGRASQYTKSLR